MTTTNWTEMKPTETENKIISGMAYNGFDRESTLRALRVYNNAEKVLRVMELKGLTKRGHASYVVYPIISQIGERTPEQYVSDVDAAAAELYAVWLQYAKGKITMAEYSHYLSTGKLLNLAA